MRVQVQYGTKGGETEIKEFKSLQQAAEMAALLRYLYGGPNAPWFDKTVKNSFRRGWENDTYFIKLILPDQD